jgi:hypothetical protein
LEGKRFDLIMCIEGFHCLSNPAAVLRDSKEKLDNEGSLVIVDAFHKEEIADIENKFTKDHGYIIHKKDVINFMVKHAM